MALHFPRTAIALLALLLAGLATSANAAREGFHDRRSWVGPDGKTYTIGVLYEDALFGPSPGRPAVADAQGRYVAFGPLTYNAVVRCTDQRDCHVLLIADTLVRAVPTPAGFNAPTGGGKSIMTDDFAEYGFTIGAAWPLDYWRMLVAPLFNNTAIALLSLAFFGTLGVICGVVTALRSRLAARFPWNSLGGVALTLVSLVVWTGSLYVMVIPMIVGLVSMFAIVPLLACFAGTAFGFWRLLAAR